ncbi:MAG TPA: glycosyltransferase family 4 protein [Hanamia sp.]
MKIAIVSFYLMESTIPLAKYLSLSGNQIDLYSLLPYGDQNTFVYNFLGNPQRNGFVDARTARTAIGENLNSYLLGLKLKIFIYPDRWFQKLFLEDFIYAYKLAKYVKKKKYDMIHIIHFSKRFWLFFYLFLPKKKIIQTLHEVTSHEEKTSFLDASRLKWLIKNSTPIIFHSNISKMRFLEFRKTVTTKKIIENNLTMIRFGLFETYQCFSNQASKPKPNGKINILNFGRIVPSKGIHFLIEAVKILQDQYPINLIIAGNGTPYFEFDNVKNYEFINRFISNEEIVSLIESCDMVVLPYTSASQSGVPMTVYNFNKPIIASDIAGFKEVIDNLNTGILVEDTNALSLASAIEILLSNTELRNKMSNNIKNKYSEGEFSWPFIADKTLSFYQTHQVNN